MSNAAIQFRGLKNMNKEERLEYVHNFMKNNYIFNLYYNKDKDKGE